VGGGGVGGGFPKIECRLGRIEKLTATETKKIKLNIPTLMLGLESKTQAKGYFIFTSTLAPLTLIMLFCVKNVENFTPEKKKDFFGNNNIFIHFVKERKIGNIVFDNDETFRFYLFIYSTNIYACVGRKCTL
jgi:hypothetical protein